MNKHEKPKSQTKFTQIIKNKQNIKSKNTHKQQINNTNTYKQMKMCQR